MPDPGEDPFKIRREVLWLNKKIQIGRKNRNIKEVFYRKWYEKGIIRFHDILDDRRNIKSIQELTREYGVEVQMMEYNRLIYAIPQSWKRSVKKMRIPKEAISNKEQLFVITNNRTLALGVTKNRDIYWELVSRKQIKPIVTHKWCTALDIPEDEWMSVFKTYASLKDTKLKAFQLYLKRHFNCT
jgi:hypothetical protein